jgi:hypothetical protein
MTMSKVIGVCVCLVGLTPLVWGQNDPAQSQLTQNQVKEFGGNQDHTVIPGFLDPRTGRFTTQAKNSIAPTAAPASTFIFNIVFNFTIQNDLPPGSTTTCNVSIYTTDPAGTYSEGGSGTATSGGTACTVTFLFSWALATNATDVLGINYSVSGYGGGVSRTTSQTPTNLPMSTFSAGMNVVQIAVTI